MNNETNKKMNRIYIFGAKATAAGLYKALTKLHPEEIPDAFIVTSAKENPTEIWGCPVLELDEVAKKLTDEDKSESIVYVAVPEFIHDEIRHTLENKGFCNIKLLDSWSESQIMEQYYMEIGMFPSVHALDKKKTEDLSDLPKLTVYAASFYKDKVLKQSPILPDYIKKIYLGCALAKNEGVDIGKAADFYDDTGDNISEKNPNRCEMTAHYWVWKNRLGTDDEYVGICHYRRILDISDDDLIKIKQNDIDVILPFPMIHYPKCLIHHSWYVKEDDWKVAMKAISEIHPEYVSAVSEVFEKPYFYNFNIMLAKKKVFADYCAWLFPILDRIEEMSKPKGTERHDRYTAYICESLTTLYFMCNRDKLKIAHTGRLLFK